MEAADAPDIPMSKHLALVGRRAGETCDGRYPRGAKPVLRRMFHCSLEGLIQTMAEMVHGAANSARGA